jgi:hypothetical protein
VSSAQIPPSFPAPQALQAVSAHLTSIFDAILMASFCIEAKHCGMLPSVEISYKTLMRIQTAAAAQHSS